MSKITEPTKETLELSAKIVKAAMDNGGVDPKTRIANTGKDFYATVLPDDISTEQLKRVAAFNTQFATSLAHAVGELGLPFAKENKDAEHVGLVVPTIGREKWEADYQRERTVVNPRNPSERTVKYGSVTIKHKVHATGNHGGEMTAVLAGVSERSAAALAD